MSALKERHERWEYENRQKLERVLSVAQIQLKKQTHNGRQALSFLLFLVYGVIRCLLRSLQLLWIQPRDWDPQIQDAEQQRLKKGIYPSNWLK